MPKFIMLPPQGERSRSWAARLSEALPDYNVVTPESDEEARREIVDADAAFGTLREDLLPLAQRLRWLQSPAIAPSTGFYYPELAEHPVVITNPRGTFNDHIGQHIMMYVLGLARGLPYYMDAQRAHRWDKRARQSEYIDLGEATALIVGVGGIGQEAAKHCNAFGMRVIGVDARWEFDTPSVERHGPDEVDALLPEADFVILTIPHTPQTEGTWTAARFALMKSSAYFINIGRGMTTVLNDLVTAIESGQIAGAGLDVYDEEPLPAEHPLWSLTNVILTPHVAAADATNIGERQLKLFLENARRFAAGEGLLNVVDKTLWY